MTKFGNNTLFGLIHDYLKLYLPKQRKLSQNTIRSYREALELLVDFAKEKKGVPLHDVTFEMLTAVILCAPPLTDIPCTLMFSSYHSILFSE